MSSNTESQSQSQNHVISNSDALRDKIHSIHNYLRNHGAGYGMNALKVFNILYGLKKIEENGLIDRVKLKRPQCEFSYLLKLANQHQNEELCSVILKDVLDSIYASELNYFLFYEIPKDLRANVFQTLVKEINQITLIEKSCHVQLSGKIYEYFIGRDDTAISELGAYFTNREIVDFCFEKLNISIDNKDNQIPTMIDPFGGSGGFTTGYINYLNQKYSKGINWQTEINKIYHYDMNIDVIKSAGLEFFCLTGFLPPKNNLKNKNTFTDEFAEMKFKYVVSNPPYGGDKNKESESQIKRNKVCKFIKSQLTTITDPAVKQRRKEQLKRLEIEEKNESFSFQETRVTVESCSDRIKQYAKTHKLEGSDKESASLILFMDLVEKDGTVLGVLKEGVFFNNAYKDLRQHLVNNFNVRNVISVPSNQFENTTTKTSIIIFDNTDIKTSTVTFSELVVEKYTEDVFEEIMGEIVLVNNKDDTKSIKDVFLCEISKDDILKNKTCSLLGNDYIKSTLIPNEGYKMVKLGEICKFEAKSKRLASFGQETGQYNFYTSGIKVMKCDVADYTKDCILIGNGGNSCIYYASNFSCSSHVMVLTSEKVNLSYIYHCIKSMWSEFISLMHGSTIRNFTKDMIVNFEIPIPASQNLMDEWMNNILPNINNYTYIELYNMLFKNESTIINLNTSVCENKPEITTTTKTSNVLNEENKGKRKYVRKRKIDQV
jgi:type I restriction-modification system DNA methylase subunit